MLNSKNLNVVSLVGMTKSTNNELNTFSNGCLGSHIDEERSEMRYVMRIAKPVSHQNFERNLHFLWGVCLLECLFIPTINQLSIQCLGLK